ncbi:MAG: type II toxin-antitoxin system RelE/ParE family toxin [Cyclobacteriaceae bacterium]
MARKIIWSIKASIEKDQILTYWLYRNRSKSYPKKLDRLFHQCAKTLSKHPFLGRRTSYAGVHVKLIRDYFLFYKFDSEFLYVLRIWDARRKPEDSPFRL